MASEIPPDLLQRIREANDIVEVVRSYGVELKPKSRNMFGLCPFHEEKAPSFSVRPDGQFFYCFGCGKKGDVFSFVMELESVTFPEAAEMLAGRAGIPIVRDERDVEEARRIIGEFVGRYNREWLNERLGYRSPAQARADYRAAQGKEAAKAA